MLSQQGIPEGYCGICERCGKPGHTQHFPGPIPYTGSWCDHCVRIVGWTWLFTTPVGLVPLVVIVLGILMLLSTRIVFF